MSKTVDIFINENVAPKDAKYIGVYDNEGKMLGKIKTGPLTFDRGNKLYSFAIMSDTHYNDTDDKDLYSDDNDDFNEDMSNALRFLSKDTDASFICCAGDVTSDNMAHAEHFYNIKKSITSMPFYTCTGNHDNKSIYNNGSLDEWKRFTFPENNPYMGTTEFAKGDYDPSFCFTKTLPSGKKDVFVFLSLDYGINSTESDGIRYYSDDTLTWFEGVLENHKADRCFVFTHLFFKEKAGNPNKVYTDVRVTNPKYWLSGAQYDRLDALNKKYKNSVWFTGHSHFHWDSQKSDKNANVFTDNSKSAYNVHIPSLARPLFVSNSYDNNGSQGGIVDVYEDYIEIRGINFQLKNRSDNDFAKLDFGRERYLKADDFTVDESRDTVGSVYDNVDGSVTVTLNAKSGFFVTCPTFNKNDTRKRVFSLKVDHVKITDNFGNDITGVDTIGFMNNTLNPFSYSIKDNAYITYLSGIGCAFRASGNYKGSYPVEVNLKAKLMVTDPLYENKYIPIADYVLHVGHG